MARKPIDYDYTEDLKESRGNHQELVNQVSSMAKKLNNRFGRLEEKGEGLKESAYTYAKAELNSDTPRYITSKKDLKSMSDSDLYELGKSLNLKLKSQTSTLTGVRAVDKKRISNATYELNSKLGLLGTKDEISEKSFRNFIKNGGSELLNNKMLSSTQVVEDWLEYTKKGIKKTDFIKLFKEYQDKHTTKKGKVDIGKIRSEFDLELRNPKSIHVKKNKLSKVKKGKSTKVTKAYKTKKKSKQ